MSGEVGVPLGTADVKKRGRLADFLVRLAREKPLGAASGIVVLVLLLVGIFADLLAPYGMNEIHLKDRLDGPSAQYWLGTDQLGRDLFSRIIYGARISVIIGLSATTISIVGATVLGTLSGFIGGKFDLIVQRFVDAYMAFPGLIVLITVMSMVGRGVPQIILVLGISGWFGGSRVSRSAVMAIKGNMYISAAQAVGSPTLRTVWRHVLPNIAAPIIIVFTTRIGGVILAEASLSFLGFGLPPDVASWGGMLSGEGRKYMELAPRLALWPGVCLSFVVYAINMLGDALRDLLDPRLRGGVGRMGAGSAQAAQKTLRKKQARAGKS